MINLETLRIQSTNIVAMILSLSEEKLLSDWGLILDDTQIDFKFFDDVVCKIYESEIN